MTACLSVSAQDEFTKYLTLNANNFPHDLDPQEFYILNYQGEYLDKMLKLVETQPLPGGNLPEMAMRALSDIAGSHEPRFTFAMMKKLAEGYESAIASDKEKLNYIERAYMIMGKSALPEALEFLEQRASFEFWSGKHMPRDVHEFTDTPDSVVETAQGLALYAIALHPSAEAQAFLSACQNDPRFVKDRYLSDGIKIDLDFYNSSLADYYRREDAWKKRAKLFNSNGAGDATRTKEVHDDAPTIRTLSLKSSGVSVQSNSKSDRSYLLILVGVAIVLAGGYVLFRRK